MNLKKIYWGLPFVAVLFVAEIAGLYFVSYKASREVAAAEQAHLAWAPKVGPDVAAYVDKYYRPCLRQNSRTVCKASAATLANADHWKEFGLQVVRGVDQWYSVLTDYYLKNGLQPPLPA